MIFLPNLTPITNIYSALYYMQLRGDRIFLLIVNRDEFNYFTVIVPQLYDPIKRNVISRENIREKT